MSGLLRDEQMTDVRHVLGEKSRGLDEVDGGMTAPEGSRWRQKTTMQTLDARIRSARLDLPPDSPEYRAAVVLLLAHEIGFNVDRIVMPTRYPRQFVAQCLRRLADNAVWVDGTMKTSWTGDSLNSRDFWLDVEVGLGRYLRRIGPDGRPQWAPVGVWVKNFNYQRLNDSGALLPNDYYRIEPHNPLPDGPLSDDGLEPEERAEPDRDPAETGVVLEGLPSLDAVEAPSDFSSDADLKVEGGSAKSAATESECQLVENWAGADWLI
jgi:hypothetical protein